MTDHTTEEKINRAVLVGLNAACLSREENATESSMEELSALLETAGGVCVGTVLQNKDAPDPRTFIGEGKAAEVKALAEAAGADMVILDNALSPSQQRVLSEELGGGDGPLRTHSRHLRTAGQDKGGAAPGGAGPV